MSFTITVLPENRIITAESGTTLLKALRAAGLGLDAPCGGSGSCGKCLVELDDELVYACHTVVDRDMTVTLVAKRETASYEHPLLSKSDTFESLSFAVDLGTTTVVVFLLNERGELLASASSINAQTAYGADVVTRIQASLKGDKDALLRCVREQLRCLMAECIQELSERMKPNKLQSDPETSEEASVLPEIEKTLSAMVRTIALVGNPAMQQLFLGIPTDNLAAVPFNAVLREENMGETPIPPMRSQASRFFPAFPNAEFLTIPDIAGFVGADTVGCVLSLGMHKKEPVTLMIDIGTNGEIVLGNRDRLLSTATAAGPALEGANISKGMRASAGAIDHVSVEGGALKCHTIDDAEPVGICGSGLIDAVAASIELGLLNRRGRIQPSADPEQKEIRLSEQVSLTQQDIRELQLSKGAIAAGIELLVKHYGITYDDISEVLLAGAFGSYMNPDSALAIGLLPRELSGKIRAVGNAAGAGAKLISVSPELLAEASEIASKTEFLELSTDPDFQLTFAMNMYFDEKAELE